MPGKISALAAGQAEAATYDIAFTGDCTRESSTRIPFTSTGSFTTTGTVRGDGFVDISSFDVEICGLDFSYSSPVSPSPDVYDPALEVFGFFRSLFVPDARTPQIIYTYLLTLSFDPVDRRVPIIRDKNVYLSLIIPTFGIVGVDGVGSYSVALSSPAIPVPAALPLLATGLGTLGVIGWRRKRKLAQAHA